MTERRSQFVGAKIWDTIPKFVKGLKGVCVAVAYYSTDSHLRVFLQSIGAITPFADDYDLFEG